MKRLLILTSDFIPNIGGIAANTLNLFNLLKRKHKVDMYVFGIAGKNFESVKYINKPKLLIPLYLKKILNSKKYDAVLVCTVLPLGWMLNLIKTDVKKIYFVYGQEVLHDIVNPPKLREGVKSIIAQSEIIVVNSNYTNGLIDGKGKVFYPLIEKISDSKEKTSSDSFTILNVGRFVKHKNYFSMLRIIKDIDKETFNKTNKHVHLEIIGDGPLKDKFEQYIKNNDISKIVSIFRRINIENLKKAYRKSDIITLPSIKTKENVEGFGIVAQEAGLYGTVAVGYDSGGIRESIMDNDLIVKENDETGLKILIVKLLTDKVFYNEKSKSATLRAEKFIAYERRLEEFERILDIKK